jgi:hypothetical protein
MKRSFTRLIAAGRLGLLAGAGLGLAAFSPTQPQSVVGPCQVKSFFIVALGTSNTTMTVEGPQACQFTLLNPDLQLFQSAAWITTPPKHGQAQATLIEGGRSAAVTYTPAPGYTGPDRFTATIEPNDKAVIVTVAVRGGAL